MLDDQVVVMPSKTGTEQGNTLAILEDVVLDPKHFDKFTAKKLLERTRFQNVSMTNEIQQLEEEIKQLRLKLEQK